MSDTVGSLISYVLSAPDKMVGSSAGKFSPSAVHRDVSDGILDDVDYLLSE